LKKRPFWKSLSFDLKFFFLYGKHIKKNSCITEQTLYNNKNSFFGGLGGYMYIDIGMIFGIFVIILYVLTILNYVVKQINKAYGARMKSKVGLYKTFVAFMRFIVRNHRLMGMLTVLFLLAHVYVQYTNYGYISQTGAVAAIILIIQVGLGIYGSKSKKKTRNWLYVHRSVAIVLPFAIAVHVL
jgi:hypothetical protein